MENKNKEFAEILGITLEELLASRTGDMYICTCRQAVAYYYRKKGLTVKDAGKMINKHHTSITYSENRFANLLEVKDIYAVEIWGKINEVTL